MAISLSDLNLLLNVEVSSVFYCQFGCIFIKYFQYFYFQTAVYAIFPLFFVFNEGCESFENQNVRNLDLNIGKGGYLIFIFL